MEEIYKDIKSYIDILKGHIEAQKIKRQTLKDGKAKESLSYAIGMEVGLAALQNIQDKVEKKLKINKN